MQGLGWAGGKRKTGIRQFDLEPAFILWVQQFFSRAEVFEMQAVFRPIR